MVKPAGYRQSRGQQHIEETVTTNCAELVNATEPEIQEIQDKYIEIHTEAYQSQNATKQKKVISRQGKKE